MTIPSEGKVVQNAREIQERMAAASPTDLHTANEDFRLVSAYLEKDQEQLAGASVTMRTIRRWARAFQDAQASFGSGYIGLLPNTSRRGNRQSKAPEDSRTLLQSYITNYYETLRDHPHGRPTSPISGNVKSGISSHFHPARFIVTSNSVLDTNQKAQGIKAAYSEEPWHWELSQATPRHGNRPFAVVHIDHTELDVMLVSSVTGKTLGKPWVTFLVDAYSRRLLAVT